MGLDQKLYKIKKEDFTSFLKIIDKCNEDNDDNDDDYDDDDEIRKIRNNLCQEIDHWRNDHTVSSMYRRTSRSLYEEMGIGYYLVLDNKFEYSLCQHCGHMDKSKIKEEDGYYFIYYENF